MAPAPPDRAQRETATDARRSFIVQSPAGSGKTELLVTRFLRLLGTVDRPQRILAITFTRKATQEMAERILRRLADAEAGKVPVTEHGRLAHHLALAALERDRQLGWELLHNPAQLQIHTIDGLCARIAARGSEPGGVAALRITEQPQALYAEAARRVIERVAFDEERPGPSAALGSLFVRLRGSLGWLQTTLVTELGRRDHWLGRVAGAVGNLPEILGRRQEDELEILERTLGHDAIRRLAAAMSAMSKAGGDVHRAQAWNVASRAVADSADDPATRVREMHELLSSVATGGGLPMAPVTLKRVFRQAAPEDWDGWLEEIVEICDGWRRLAPSSSLFQRWCKSPPLDTAPGNEQLLTWMYELLQQACAELRVLFSERGVCDFQHVAELAMAALGDELAPGEALLLEDGRLEHMLVDEFQDTSRIQYDLLCRLTSGWAREDGRSLFLVGDPMQSIYRFRKADVALFQRVFHDARLGEVELQPLRLTANFRSCQAIIDFANQHFPKIFTAPSPAATTSVDYAPFSGQVNGEGRVAVYPNPAWIGAEGEAAQVAELVARLREDDPDQLIGILARKRLNLEPVAEALGRLDIAFEAVDVQALSLRPVVGDLLALTRALLHPGDRIAWLTLLHAPWCGLEPAELQIVAGDRFEEDMMERLGQPALLRALPNGVRRRLKVLKDVMQEALESACRQELHRRVEAAWIRLQAPFALAGPADLADAQVFLELLARVEAEEHPDVLSALESELNRLRAGSRPARVRLMTIHKAKGLEFDVVVIPGMDATAGRSTVDLFRQHVFGFKDGRRGSLIAPVKPAGHELPSLYDYLGRLDSEDEESESQRVLYVALTRARRELHLFGRWSLKGSGAKRAPGAPARSFMQLLWEPFGARIESQDWREKEPQESPAGDTEPETWPQLRLSGLPAPALHPEAAAQATVDASLDRSDRDTRALGTALHLWLELIHDQWSDDWLDDWFDAYRPALESSLAHAGARPDSIAELCGRLYGMLRAMLDNTDERVRIRWPEVRQSYAEAAFYLATGPRLKRCVLDRLVENAEGGWQVVDYKTGQPTPENQGRWSQQLLEYRQVVTQALGGGVSCVQILQISDRVVTALDELPRNANVPER